MSTFPSPLTSPFASCGNGGSGSVGGCSVSVVVGVKGSVVVGFDGVVGGSDCVVVKNGSGGNVGSTKEPFRAEPSAFSPAKRTSENANTTKSTVGNMQNRLFIPFFIRFFLFSYGFCRISATVRATLPF